MEEEVKLDTDIDINQALKEFDEKYGNSQTGQNTSALKNSETSKMVGLVMKFSRGYIKDEKQAQYVLLGVAVLMIIVSLFLVFNKTINKARTEAPAGYRIIYPQNEPPQIERIL